jgi:RNA polymerase sigma factor (sigma-70 family)
VHLVKRILPMATPSIREVVEHLCAWGDAGTLAGLPDGQLLERFINRREEAAFAALLRRHGPMVLRVCRRVLGRIQDAEDVFQATFLLLARKGRRIHKRDAVGSWLHGVAHRLAVRTKDQARRRQVHEQQAANLHRAEPTLEAAWSEVQAALDEELRGLPEKYRAVLVLCYLEGQSQEEATRHLGCPLGTVRSRLARARSLFQKRLIRRGLAPSAAALGSALLVQAASATVPVTLLRHTLKAALTFAAGRALGSEISASVVLHAEAGLKAMSAAKLKLALTLIAVTVALSAGAGVLAVHVLADKTAPAEQETGPKAAVQKLGASKAVEAPIDRTVREGDVLPAGAIRRLGSPRFRHDHGNTSWMATAFAHNGKMLATCAVSVRLWDLTTGKLLREIETGKLQWKTDGCFWTTGSMLFSPDDKVLAVQAEKAIYLLDSATGKLLHRLAGEGLSPVFAFSPDGKLLATGGPCSPAKDGTNWSVSLWDTATGRQIANLRGHNHKIHSAAFTPDGRTLVTACYRNRICRWDVARGELRKSIDLPLPEGREARLSPDGSTLAIASPLRQAKSPDTDSLWDTETGRQRCTLPSRRSQDDYGLAFSPDGGILATDSTEAGTDQKTIFFWDVGTAKRISRFKVSSRAAFVLTFAPDGKTLLSSGPEPQVRLWDTATGKQFFAETGHAGAIAALSFTPDGRTLVSGADDDTLRVWDIAASRFRRSLSDHRGGVHALAVASDGKSVLSGSADGCLRLHDLDTGEERRRFVIDKQPQALRAPDYQVRSLVLAADGRTAASWSATGLRERALFHVWELATGKALVRRADPSGFGLRLFSPDAKVVLSCIGTDPVGPGGMGDSVASTGMPQPSPSTVVLSDVASGRQILPLPQPDSYGYVQAFAPDGRTLVTATGKLRGFEAFPSDQHTLHLWELATGKERLTIAPGKTGWEYRFEHVAFAPDGRTLATLRADRTIQLWDLATGAELLSRTGYSARVSCLAFSPDSRVLASGHTDSTILLWDVNSGRRARRESVEKSAAGQLERWWRDLAGEDARKAHAAIWGLCAVPERAVNLLRARLHPASAVSANKIQQRIADLDSDEFQRREAASAELAALGDRAYAALQAALKANPSVELRKRIQDLLADPGRVRSTETLRQLRAMEVLERIASRETRQILKTLAQGAPDARQTREAKAALARLSRP